MQLPDYFSKGLCSNYGNNRMPHQYSPDLRNVRIENGVSIPRKGHKTAVSGGTWPVRGIVSNNGNLYACVDSKFKLADLSAGTFSDVGSFFEDVRINPLVFGKYTILLGDRWPIAYDGDTFVTSISYAFAGTVTDRVFTGTGLDNMTITGGNNDFDTDLYEVKITVATTPNSFQWRVNAGAWSSDVTIVAGNANVLWTGGISVTFATNSNHMLNDLWTFTANPRAKWPRFGAKFSNFTWVAGADYYSNVLYVSRPITAANQEYCYDWTGSGSDSMVFESEILALSSTLSRLFIFRKGGIDWIDRSSYTTVWSVATFRSNPLAEWEDVVSPSAAVAAGDKLFFLTESKKIKTVNYVMGVDQVEIGELSDDPETGITAFMDSLDDDQSDAFGYFDSVSKLVKFHVKSSGAAFNDTVIVWDMVAKTFLVDDSKFFSCLVTHDGKTYAGSSINASAFQDETGTDDDGQPISGYRKGAPLSGWRHGEYKLWMGAITTGTINGSTTISKTLVVDGDPVDQSSISKPAAALGASVWSNPVGSSPVWGPTVADVRRNFVKDRTDGYCNVPWRYFAADYSWSGVSGDFSLETLETQEKATNYREPSIDS